MLRVEILPRSPHPPGFIQPKGSGIPQARLLRCDVAPWSRLLCDVGPVEKGEVALFLLHPPDPNDGAPSVIGSL